MYFYFQRLLLNYSNNCKYRPKSSTAPEVTGVIPDNRCVILISRCLLSEMDVRGHVSDRVAFGDPDAVAGKYEERHRAIKESTAAVFCAAASRRSLASVCSDGGGALQEAVGVVNNVCHSV